MSYTAKNLVEGEEITHKARLHWLSFVPAVLIMTLSIVFLMYVSKLTGETGLYARYLAYAFFAFGGAQFLTEYIKHKSYELAVTNKRVFITTGLINIKSMAINLAHVETVEVDQSFWGRLLDFGSIQITATGGAGTKKPIHYVQSPMLFRKSIQTYKDGDPEEENDAPKKSKKTRTKNYE
ncbi:MAG: hypothetical protein EAZ55_07835 [Cytophagales bacterium]|nr:MAG: hypothetical protein EAZ55_07835 [Cytophagales bacterium]